MLVRENQLFACIPKGKTSLNTGTESPRRTNHMKGTIPWRIADAIKSDLSSDIGSPQRTHFGTPKKPCKIKASRSNAITAIAAE
jgi:hypothetical protein